MCLLTRITPRTVSQTGWPRRFLGVAAVLLLLSTSAAQSDGQFGRVERIDRDAFLPEAGLIQFSELPENTADPVYRPGDYGGPAEGVTVTFGGYFAGQRIGPKSQCPPGASPTGCVTGNPSAPLRLAPDSPATFTSRDGSNPNTPSLSGSPRFNGPVSMVFDQDVAGVGLYGGYFNAKESTAIRAFDRNGHMIGGVKNIGRGMEYLALVTDDGSERIAGLQFSLVGPEPAGYAIDDLSFAKREQLDDRRLPNLRDTLMHIEAVEDDKPPPRPPIGAVDPPPLAEPVRPQGSLGDLFEGQLDVGRQKPAPEPPGTKRLQDLFDP